MYCLLDNILYYHLHVYLCVHNTFIQLLALYPHLNTIEILWFYFCRQKNQEAIRTSENQLEDILTSIDLVIDINKSQLISPHIKSMCGGTNGAIYTSENDIRKSSSGIHKTWSYPPNSSGGTIPKLVLSI